MHTNPVPSAAPGELTVDRKLPTTVELSWSPLPKNDPNGVITGYTVKVIVDDSQSEQLNSTVTTNSIEIPDLRPFTSYTFKVSAKTKAGSGPAATTSSTTPEAGKWHTMHILVK